MKRMNGGYLDPGPGGGGWSFLVIMAVYLTLIFLFFRSCC